MNYNEFIEIDALNEVFVLKNHSDKSSEFIIKIKDYDLKFDELKIKKDAIEFFVSQNEFKNPLASEFSIHIFTKNSKIIILEYTGNNQKETQELYEFIKSILI